MTTFTRRPETDEYDPYYAQYVTRVPDGDVLAGLAAQLDEVRGFAAEVPATREAFRYAPGKWTVKDVLRHVADTERVFGYRALCIARGDPTPLPGFDQDAYAAAGTSDPRPLAALVDEFEHLRRANLSLLRGFDGETLSRRGVMWQKTVSVRAVVFLLHGHAGHHLEVLRKRYAAAW